MTQPAFLHKHSGHASAELGAGNHLSVDGVLAGVAATGSITYASNLSEGDTITINGVLWTATEDTPGANEFAIAGTLSGTLDNMVTALTNSTDELLTRASYAKSGSTILLITYDYATDVGNGFTLDASVGTLSDDTLTGGRKATPIDLSVETYVLVTDGSAAQNFYLPAGNDGQEVTLYLGTKGSGSNAVVNGLFGGSNTKLTFDAAGEWAKLKWIAGAWRAIVNSGALSS